MVQIPYAYLLLVIGPSPGPAPERPEPVHFLGLRLKILRRTQTWPRLNPGSTQAEAQLFEKGLENWSFYEVKIRGLSRLRLEFLWRAWARALLGIGLGSIF